MPKHYIDYLRVVAILAVITIHATAPYYGNLAVLLGKAVNPAEFYRKRAVRLLPPLAFWTLAYTAFNAYTGESLDTLLWFVKIGLLVEGSAHYHLWYLSMFVCLMAFAPFLSQYLNGHQPTASDLRTLVLVAFVFFALNGLSHLLQGRRGLDMHWFKSFPWFMAYFVAGHYLDRHANQWRVRWTVSLPLVLTLTLIGA